MTQKKTAGKLLLVHWDETEARQLAAARRKHQWAVSVVQDVVLPYESDWQRLALAEVGRPFYVFAQPRVPTMARTPMAGGMPSRSVCHPEECRNSRRIAQCHRQGDYEIRE